MKTIFPLLLLTSLYGLHSISKMDDWTTLDCLNEVGRIKAAQAESDVAHAIAKAKEREAKKLEWIRNCKLRLNACAQADDAQAEQLLASTEEKISAARTKACARAWHIGEHMEKMTTLVGVVGMMAADSVRGTQQTQDWLDRRLQPVLEPLNELQVELVNDFNAFAHDVHARRNEIAQEMLQELEATFPELLTTDTDDVLKEWCKQIKSIHLGEGLNVLIEVPLMAFPAQRVVEYVRKMLEKHLAKLVRRAISTLTANGILVVADGPLPFGDLAAVLMDAGFIVWSAWDLWHLSGKIRDLVKSEIEESVDALTDELKAQFQQTVAEFIIAEEQQLDQLRESLHSQLK